MEILKFWRRMSGGLEGAIGFELPAHLSNKFLDKQFHDKPWQFFQDFHQKSGTGIDEMREYKMMLIQMANQLQGWAALIEKIEKTE